MKTAGWKYKRGPEPYGCVYVPPSGSVRVGSVLGKDFFFADHQLWTKAEQLGIIDSEPNHVEMNEDKDSRSDDYSLSSCDEGKLNVPPSRKPVYISSPESCSGKTELKSKKVISDDLDDQKLCGYSMTLTYQSIHTISALISNFLRKNGTDMNFTKDLWLPIWRCINGEQGSPHQEQLAWGYTKSRGAGKLGRNHWYSPPNSKLGAKGEIGRDYFTTEEAVVAFLLREVKKSGNISICKNLLEEFEIRLSRAMEQFLPFDEVHLVSFGKTKRRIRKRNLFEVYPHSQKSYPKAKRSNHQRGKSDRDTSEQIQMPLENLMHSQNTIKGAEILLELTKSNYDQKGEFIRQKNPCIVTKRGVTNLLDFRRKRKRKASKMLTTVCESPKKVKKKSPENYVCHLTQATEDLKLESWISPIPSKRQNGSKLLLKGFTFFGSGIDIDVVKRVTKLGGIFLREVEGESMKRPNVVKKVFFLSDVTNRRTHKYLLACALGVPMLHFGWLDALEHKLSTFQSEVASAQTNKIHKPSVFDANLYKAYR